jgi:hypothetical protein
MKDAPATRKDIDDVLTLMQTFMHQVDDRFNRLEDKVDVLQSGMERVLKRLDSIEKDLSISDDERAVMGMQLTRLHDWVE